MEILVRKLFVIALVNALFFVVPSLPVSDQASGDGMDKPAPSQSSQTMPGMPGMADEKTTDEKMTGKK